MHRSIALICHAFIVITLTLLTQIGGLAYIIALLATRRWRRAEASWRKSAGSVTAATLAIYAAASVVVVPPLARHLGRVAVPCSYTTLVGCALNRAYLRPQALKLATDLNEAIADQYPGSRATILEGSFPFLDGFPLPPHLSHHDGRKIDLAYFYRDAARGLPIARGSPSPIGYFHFQQPGPGEAAACSRRITSMRWSFAWLQPKEPAWILDEERMRAMILWLKARPDVTRIFIEPYLAHRLGVGGTKVRFQGCHAVRHDDHLHVEIR